MPPVLVITLYPMRDGTSWGATIRWSERDVERTLRILGGASRKELLGAIGAVFDCRSGGTVQAS